MSIFDKFLPKKHDAIPTTPNSKDFLPTQPTTVERGTPRWKEALAFGGAALALTACSPSENAAEAPTPVTIPISAESSNGTETPTPITSATETYTIPGSEGASVVSSEVATTPATSVDTVASTPLVEEVTPPTPEIETPTFAVTEYQGNSEQLAEAVVKEGLQGWANAGSTPETRQIILDKVAAGASLDDVVASIATDNQVAFVKTLFGKNLDELSLDEKELANTLLSINTEALKGYVETVDSTDPDLHPFTVAITPLNAEQLYDVDAGAMGEKVGVSFTINSNASRTSLTTDPIGTRNEGITFIPKEIDGNYTLTELHYQFSPASVDGE
ncbi:MAG: hypothetical protein WBP22_05745 [Candidatus Saccharimonas sp.]